MSAAIVVAVLDTNVLISGLISQPSSPPARLLTAWTERRFSVVTSAALLAEFQAVTLRPHIRTRLHASHLQELWRTIREGAMVVTPASGVPAWTNDPADNVLFSTALAGDAGYVVTGDGKLLELGTVEAVKVVSPRTFVSTL